MSRGKRSSCKNSMSEIKYPDFYGVDMPNKDELLANQKNNQEMRDYIQSKSLQFLSLNGLYKALIGEKENLNIHNLVIITSQVIML